MGSLVRQWISRKIKDIWTKDIDIEQTDSLGPPPDTDVEQTDSLGPPPGLRSPYESDCESDEGPPVTLEDLTSRPGRVIIDISDDPPYPFYDQIYDQNHDPGHDGYDFQFNFYNPWDNSTSDYDSEEEQEERHNQDFPTIWHELLHGLMEIDRQEEEERQ